MMMMLYNGPGHQNYLNISMDFYKIIPITILVVFSYSFLIQPQNLARQHHDILILIKITKKI